MKQNHCPFCRRRCAARLAIHGVTRLSERQFASILSPKIGAPQNNDKLQPLAEARLACEARGTAPDKIQKTSCDNQFCSRNSASPRTLFIPNTWQIRPAQLVTCVRTQKTRTNKKRTRLALRGCQPGPPVKRVVVSQAAHDRCRRHRRRSREGGVHRVLPTTTPWCETCKLPAMGKGRQTPATVLLDFKPTSFLSVSSSFWRRCG